LKFPAVAEKTANKSRGLLFYAAPCTYSTYQTEEFASWYLIAISIQPGYML